MRGIDDLSLRPMCRADVPAVAAMAAEFALYLRELGDTTEFRLNAAALERDGFGPHPAFEGLIAEVNGEPQGYLLYHHGYDSDAASRVVFVADLFVCAHTRGLGVGKALMQQAAAVASASQATQLVWTVDVRNTEARRFYERLGGQVVDTLHLMSLEV